MSSPVTPADRAQSRDDVTLRTLSALGTGASDASRASANFNDLLRAASRHCRRLVHSETARIWVARRGGRRLVAKDFADETDRTGHEVRLARGEGLAGWAIENERSLRLNEGDPRPELRGRVPVFKNALVIPLFRRGEVFAAIECLNKKEEGGFTDADFDRLDVASEHVAFALDNALLYDETERRALEKEVLLEISPTLVTPLAPQEPIEALS